MAAKKPTRNKTTAKSGSSRTSVKKKPAAKKAKLGKQVSAAKTARSPKPASIAKKKPARKTGKPTVAEKKKTTRGPLLDLQALRQRLLKKQGELLQAYHSAKDDSLDRRSDGTEDYIDYAVSSYDREFLLSLTELEQDQLMLVEEAIKRIDRNDFGRCSQCDKPIPGKRLEVQPWARYCLRCQEMFDEGTIDVSEEDTEEQDVERDLDEEVDEEELEEEVGAGDADDDSRLISS